MQLWELSKWLLSLQAHSKLPLKDHGDWGKIVRFWKKNITLNFKKCKNEDMGNYRLVSVYFILEVVLSSLSYSVIV